jgi:hypothetical protein
LGTKVLPKLRSGDGLRVGIDFTVTIEPAAAKNMENEIRVILKELGCSAYENLLNILQTGKIWGSEPKAGMIKGKSRAACFIDVPFASLKYVLTPENSDPQSPRYEPYGIAVTKRFAHEAGCRPVLYLSNDEKWTRWA